MSKEEREMNEWNKWKGPSKEQEKNAAENARIFLWCSAIIIVGMYVLLMITI
jgi:hypothetical protein